LIKRRVGYDGTANQSLHTCIHSSSPSPSSLSQSGKRMLHTKHKRRAPAKILPQAEHNNMDTHCGQCECHRRCAGTAPKLFLARDIKIGTL
jgi:hypothetical protein